MESEHHAPLCQDDNCCLSEDACYELLQIRDQLLLHAHCIAPVTHQEDDAILELPRNMLADCFQQLADRLTRALEPTAAAEPDD